MATPVEIRESLAAELRSCGADPIHEMGIVAGGKRVMVEVAQRT